MNRIGRMSRLKPGAGAVYDRLHAVVWPEVETALRDCGIRNYTIFRQGEWLFSYMEAPAGRTLPDLLRQLDASPACRRWEALVTPLREASPEGEWWPLREVWHLDGGGA